MKHETEVSLIEMALSRATEGNTNIGDAAEAQWPVDYYYDPARFTREMAMVERQPMPLTHSTLLPHPRAFVTDTLHGRPIVVVRTKSGAARAFLNVCRHRGSELVLDPSGYLEKSFVCPYHGWTYDLDGNLTHVPDRERSFPALPCAERALVELPVAERHGLIWVVPRPGESDLPDSESMITEFLGPELDEEFREYGFGDYIFYRQESWSGAFNWKCAVESFLENYHFAVLHRESTNPIFIHNEGTCHRLGLHFRGIAPKKSMRTLRDIDQSEWQLRPHATILVVAFPYSVFFIEQSHYSLLQIVPEAVDRCQIRVMHAVQHASLDMRPFYEANIKLFMAAITEDLDICESMQRGFAAGANRQVVFGRNETGCDGYRQCVEEQLGAMDTAVNVNGAAAATVTS